MGNVILPSGATKQTDEIDGSINLSTLIEEMRNDEYTDSYRITVISAIGKLGKNAEIAVSYLKELSVNKDPKYKILAEASEQALLNIGTSKTDKVDNHLKKTWNNGIASGVQVVGNTTYKPKTERQKVTIVELEKTNSLHKGVKHYCKCSFCEKTTLVVKPEYSNKLSDKFYCNFCIRNDFYQRHSKNTMILTYRGLIGYYFYAYYQIPKTSSMYMPVINDYIKLHFEIGYSNPIFKYDQETFCWFIDFSKIGKRKLPVESVLTTIIQQLASFNIYENVKGSSPLKLYKKYEKAVLDFAQHRIRTRNEKIFAPTLFDCDIPTRPVAGKTILVDHLTGFLPSSLDLSKARKI